MASLGRGWRVASIGPAGERGVRFATVSHDGRHAGRGGLGAVMGAKNLKAVAVHAATRVAPADPAGVLAAARDLRARSFGPATAKYRELGTLANLLAFNAIHTLPTRNFTAATFDGGTPPRGRGPGRSAPRGPQQLRLVHDRLRAHLPRGAAAPRRGSSTRTSSPSARCAGCPTPTPCWRPAPAATRWGSTPSRPGARSPGPWSASTGGCWTRRGCGSATGPPCCGPWTRSADGRGSARCWRRGPAGRPPPWAAAPRTSPCRSRGWSCPATSRARCRRWRSGWP